MSANAAPMLPQSSTAPSATSARRVHVVSGQKVSVRPSAWPFVMIATLLLVLTIALPMVINTQMAQRAYEIRDQQITLAELNAQAETLETELLIASSPQQLEQRAKDLGLVPAGNVGAISLKAKTVEGGVAAQ